MMFGYRDVFTYFQCPVCGCLQISDIPSDMSKYYPSEYYSFNVSAEGGSWLKNRLKKLRDKYAVSGVGFSGSILNILFPADLIKVYKGIPADSKILDVGCGTGALLCRLKEAGFQNLAGIDPFNAGSIKYAGGLSVEKKSLSEMTGKWDLITYHHSFEHIAFPVEELLKVSELLADKGLCIIRIPIVDSFAWKHYKTDWIQIDAPRHFFLYSIKSFELLAEKAGMVIDKIEYDSTDFQFWGSEQYRENISLSDKRSFSINPGKSLFTREEIKKFAKKSLELNDNKLGDQIIIFLKRKN